MKQSVPASATVFVLGFLLYWSWAILPVPGEVALMFGIVAMGIGSLALLFLAFQRRKVLLLIAALPAALTVASVYFGPMRPHDIVLAMRVAAVRAQVAELKANGKDIIQAVIADQGIGKGYRRGISDSNPKAVSFEMERFFIDDGVALVLDPSRKIERFRGSDGWVDQERKGWEVYKPLLRDPPTRMKVLGEGWYLIYFT